MFVTSCKEVLLASFASLDGSIYAPIEHNTVRTSHWLRYVQSFVIGDVDCLTLDSHGADVVICIT